MECAWVGAIGDADTCEINAGFCIISFENNWKINPRWNWCSAQQWSTYQTECNLIVGLQWIYALAGGYGADNDRLESIMFIIYM